MLTSIFSIDITKWSVLWAVGINIVGSATTLTRQRSLGHFTTSLDPLAHSPRNLEEEKTACNKQSFA